MPHMPRRDLARCIAAAILEDRLKDSALSSRAIKNIDLSTAVDEELDKIKKTASGSLAADAARKLDPRSTNDATWGRFLGMVKAELKTQLRGLP